MLCAFSSLFVTLRMLRVDYVSVYLPPTVADASCVITTFPIERWLDNYIAPVNAGSSMRVLSFGMVYQFLRAVLRRRGSSGKLQTKSGVLRPGFRTRS